MDDSALLETQGTTTVSGLTIGGTVEWENTNIVNESGGSATIGDSSGVLYNTSTGIYDILSGIRGRRFAAILYQKRRPHPEDGRDWDERDLAGRVQQRNV